MGGGNGFGARVEGKLYRMYDELAQISDELLEKLLVSVERDLERGRILDLLKNLSSALPGVFLSVPFVSAFLYLGRSTAGSESVLRELGKRAALEPARTLCFVAKLGEGEWSYVPAGAAVMTHRGLATDRGPAGHGGMSSGSDGKPSVRRVITIPVIHRFERAFRAGHLKIPCRGYCLSRSQLSVPVGGREEGAAELFQAYLRWFYAQMDTVVVSSEPLMGELVELGWDSSRLELAADERRLGRRFASAN